MTQNIKWAVSIILEVANYDYVFRGKKVENIYYYMISWVTRLQQCWYLDK